MTPVCLKQSTNNCKNKKNLPYFSLSLSPSFPSNFILSLITKIDPEKMTKREKTGREREKEPGNYLSRYSERDN